MIQKKMPSLLGLNLNIDWTSRTGAAVAAAESIDALRAIGSCAIDAPSSADDLSPLRGSLCGRAQGITFLVSRPVSVHGLCATALYREPSSPSGNALSLGDSRQCHLLHFGQCQC